MKLEKFDYQIGNKKTKREFVILGVLVLFLVVTIVLYRTFANFSSTSSYSIISGRVAPFDESRKAITTKDISLTKEDDVSAILYDDGSIVISGEGNMIDFEDQDLIALITDDYISANIEFTEEEAKFVEDNQKIMNSLFDIVIRPWNFEVKDEKIDEFLNSTFTTVDKDEKTVVDEEKVNVAKGILDKIKENKPYIERLEITDKVTNIGANAFALLAAVNKSEVRDKNVYTFFYDGVDYAGNANMPILFNVVLLDTNLNEIKKHGMSDVLATGIEIGLNTTKIPNDMFAYYEGKNDSLIIPNQIKSIGINAFYKYQGLSLTLSNQLELLDEYAFASYNQGDIEIPDSLTSYKANAFRDFEGNIKINACESDDIKAFAPKAKIDYIKEECE